ncbi:MAG TPA: hypothetical protein V6C84_22240 [Coleofasciculaceae cyanobacterium]
MQLLQYDCESMQDYCSRYKAIAIGHNAIVHLTKPLQLDAIRSQTSGTSKSF